MHLSNTRTLSGVLIQLQDNGYTHGFKLENNQLICLESGTQYNPEDLQIIEYHRFEGESNPADMAVVFAVKCRDGVKGTIVSSFGTYADNNLIAFMDRVSIRNRAEVSG